MKALKALFTKKSSRVSPLFAPTVTPSNSFETSGQNCFVDNSNDKQSSQNCEPIQKIEASIKTNITLSQHQHCRVGVRAFLHEIGNVSYSFEIGECSSSADTKDQTISTKVDEGNVTPRTPRATTVRPTTPRAHFQEQLVTRKSSRSDKPSGFSIFKKSALLRNNSGTSCVRSVHFLARELFKCDSKNATEDSKTIEFFGLGASSVIPDLDCVYYLALCYYTRRAVEQNYEQAVKLVSSSAAKNHLMSLNMLGLIYRIGIGIKRDYKKSLELFEQAARLTKNGVTFYNLGLIFCEGLGVKRNVKKGLHFINLAMKMSEPAAIFYFGECHLIGKHVEKDPCLAVKYFRLAAEQSYADAICALATCYCNGNGVKQDYQLAARLYSEGANLGCEKSLSNLGTCFYNGEGVEQDYARAIEFYEAAVKLNDNMAIFNIGVCYFFGQHVEKNCSKGFEFFKRAADLNVEKAHYWVALCYAHGYGVEKDHYLAYKVSAKLNLTSDNKTIKEKTSEMIVMLMKKSPELAGNLVVELLGNKKQLADCKDELDRCRDELNYHRVRPSGISFDFARDHFNAAINEEADVCAAAEHFKMMTQQKPESKKTSFSVLDQLADSTILSLDDDNDVEPDNYNFRNYEISLPNSCISP